MATLQPLATHHSLDYAQATLQCDSEMIFFENIQQIIGECNLAAPVYLHVFPHSGNKLSYYRDKLIIGGIDAISDENKYQTRDNFKSAETIVSLVPIDRDERYVFAGAYHVMSRSHLSKDGKEYTVIENSFSDNLINQYFGRLVFKWSSPVRNRYLTLANNGTSFLLVEMREKPYGALDVAFPGFYSFHLNRLEFDSRIGEAMGTSWEEALSSVSGVYVITDTETGQSYVGSAYSETGLPNGGIWGRWKGYLKGGDNGNILLKEHIQKHGAEHLVYSILHTMDIGARKEDVIRMETFYKEAFGTRIHGLNKN